MFGLLIFFMVVTQSLQATVIVKEEKYCQCYDRCQKNFTVNATVHEQSKAACERGCRFYSLVLHSFRVGSPSVEKAKAKEKCQTSCMQSYMNSTDVSACNFGCSLMKLTDGDVCAVLHHGPQDVIEFVFDESTAVIHLEEPELDDVLIDIGLKNQLENSFGNNRFRKQKLPEISFTNLPVSKPAHSAEEHRGVAIIECPRLYELYVRFALRHRKITNNDFCFVVAILIIAIMFFTVNRHLEKHRKLWKQIFVGVLQDGQERVGEDDLVVIDCLPGKDGYENDPMDETKDGVGKDCESLTLVYYEEDDDPSYYKKGRQEKC